MAIPKELADAVKAKYKSPDVQQAILDNIEENKTADRILSGELFLPTDYDATVWHRRTTQQNEETEQRNLTEQRLAALEAKLSAKASEGKK